MSYGEQDLGTFLATQVSSMTRRCSSTQSRSGLQQSPPSAALPTTKPYQIQICRAPSASIIKPSCPSTSPPSRESSSSSSPTPSTPTTHSSPARPSVSSKNTRQTKYASWWWWATGRPGKAFSATRSSTWLRCEATTYFAPDSVLQEQKRRH
jgi:hypothetical protein